MSPTATALLIIVGIVGLGSFIGFLAGARRKMDLEQWTVGDRGFGLVLVWLLMAGETYTTFTFLGASGWAYSRGGPALYPRLPDASLCGFVLHPAADLGGGARPWSPDAAGFLQALFRR